MPGMTLTHRELAALRAVADPRHAAEPGPALPWSLLAEVQALVGADQVEFEQTHPERHWLGFMQSVEGRAFVPEEPNDPHYWSLWWRSTAVHARLGDAVSTTMRSDFESDLGWRNHPLYLDYMKDQGLFHELGFNLPDPDGRSLRLHCWRSPGRDFAERDRFLLSLLRPHVVVAYRAAERLRHPMLLTARQLELLAYVGRGLTNRQVARAMGLTEGTVRRHLENIYERLGVNSRTEAVARLAAARSAD